MQYIQVFRWLKRLSPLVWIVVIGVVLVAAISALFGVSDDWLVEEVVGVDKWEAHQPFYGDLTISQQFTTPAQTLSRLDVLIVDFTGRSPRTPITLTLRDQDLSEPLRAVEVSGGEVRDDFYLPFSFAVIDEAAGRTFEFTLAAPDASQEAPYAVRLAEGDAIEGGARWREGGSLAETDIAFRLYRSTTKAYVIYRWILAHEKAVTVLAVTAVFSALAIWLLPRADDTNKKFSRLLLVTIVVAGVIYQAQVLRQMQGAIGGDAYYYINAGHQIAHGINPLSIKSFRLPLYPLLLVPAVVPSMPDLLWGRLVGVAATVGIAGGLILLARSLGLRSSVAGLAVVLLYFNSDFVITSLRPRPYTVFAFLLVLTVALLFRLRTQWHIFLWGVLLGLMGMTRQEAYLPTAILGISFFIMLLRQRLPWQATVRRLVLAALPLFLIISPYFYYNYKHLGNPFASSYFTHPEIRNPDSVQDFWSSNVRGARDVLTSVWLPSSSSGMRPGSGRQFLGVSTVVLLAYLAQHGWRLRGAVRRLLRLWQGEVFLSALAALGLATVLFSWLFRDGEIWSQEVNMVIVAAMLVGMVELIRIGRWPGVMVVSILLSQIAIATWFQPQPKHYQQAFPLLALGLAAVLIPWANLPAAQREQREAGSTWRRSLRAAPLVLALTMLGAPAVAHIGNAIDEHNYPAAPYYVTINAAERLQAYEGHVASEVQYEGSNAFRFHSYLQYEFAQYEQEGEATAAQIQWLCQQDARYLIDNEALDFFTAHQDPAYSRFFRFVFDEEAYTWNERTFRVSVYEFITPGVCDQLTQTPA